MHLLTDGSVMCHELETPNWHKLVPDSMGDYVNGALAHFGAPSFQRATLSKAVPSMRPSTMLPLCLKTVAFSWTVLPTLPAWNNIGDAPSCVLPDGRVLL